MPTTAIAAILGPIEEPLTDVLEWLHVSIGLGWGWAIVVLTVAIRLILVPLTLKQIRSMQRLQVYAPELKALQAKYKNDKQKLNEEVMKFYKEKKVNPAASCFPILIQIPIFIALFFVLRDFQTEVIGPKFPDSDLSFIKIVPNVTENIGGHWSGILLLVVYVTSQVASTFYMSATMDKRQRMLFLALPFIFIPFIIRFPVGLLLYWVTTNLWTAGQGIITKRLVPRPPPPPDKRSSRTPPKTEPEPTLTRAGEPVRKKKRRKTRPAARAAGADQAEVLAGRGAPPQDTREPVGSGAAVRGGDPGGTSGTKPGGPDAKQGSAKQGADKKTQPGQVRRRKKRRPKKGPRAPR
ncbi:MAG: YidC/Oxa1 family membrane protein insertase [Actinomycetia bacterium]|nr:YidC/Oxa1 family membrane protein insertase [Actinomycetes bacterium]